MKAMSLITWSEELSVSIPSIDAQHQILINMINALDDALASGEASEVIVRIFKGLIIYTDKHFSFEENLFSQHGYGDGAAHKAKHDALRKQVMDLKAKMDEGNFMIGVELMVFLKDWLTNHIQKTDKEYVAYLTQQGVS